MGGGRHLETAPHELVIMVRFCDLGGRCRLFRTRTGSSTAAAPSWAICVAAVGPPPRKGLSETSSSLNGGGHHRFRGGQPTGADSAVTTSLPGTSGRHAGIGSRELTRRVSHIPKQSSRFPWRRIRCELSRHHRTFQQVATGAYFVVANAPANSVVRSAASARRRAWHQRTRRFSEGLWYRGCRRRSGPRMP